MSLLQQKKSQSQERRIIVMSGITLLILLAIFFFFSRDMSPKKEDLLEVSLVENMINEEYYRDTDHDGAYDWEEALWPELDPENPDSDGDGVLDGAYIRQKKRSFQEEGTSFFSENQLSQSEQLGRSIYTALLAANSNGTDETDLVSNNVIEYVSKLSLGGRTFLRDDLHLVPTQYSYAQSYARDMTALLAAHEIHPEDVRLIIQEVQDPSGAIDIHSLAREYDSYLQSLLTIKVPQTIAGRHTDLVNGVSQLSGVLTNLTTETPDDLVSLSFVVQIEQIAQKLDLALADIRTFIELSKNPALFR